MEIEESFVLQQEQRFLDTAVGMGLISKPKAAQVRAQAALTEPRKPLFVVLMELGHLDGEAVDRVLSTLAGQVEKTVAEGHRARQAQEVTRAIKAYTRAIGASPANEEPYWKRAAAHFDKRRYEEAIADYSSLLSLTARKAEAYNCRGVAHARLGRYAEAVADHEASLRLDPGSAKAWFDLGTCHQARKDLARAAESYSRAIELKPDYIEAWNNRAVAALLLGQVKQAIADWQKALEFDRQRATVLANLQMVARQLQPPRPGK